LHLDFAVICLIADNDELHILFCVFLDFVEPKLFYVLQRFLEAEVEDEHNSLCVFVVGTRNRAESFLSSSIPDLQLYRSVVKFDSSSLEKTYLNLKSTPMVARYDSSKESSANLLSREDLPTELSPIRTILYWYSWLMGMWFMAKDKVIIK